MVLHNFPFFSLLSAKPTCPDRSIFIFTYKHSGGLCRMKSLIGLLFYSANFSAAIQTNMTSTPVGPIDLTGGIDAGWQKRGSGRAHDNLSG